MTTDQPTKTDSTTPAWQPGATPPARPSRTKLFIIGGVVLLAAAVAIYFLTRPSLRGSIVIPYIAHQKPTIDPHLPSTNALADKLDEIQFDGLFNIAATPSGIIYEDALGELLGIDENNVVTVRLKTNKRWHDSYTVQMDDDELKGIEKTRDHFFSAADLKFTLRRIQALGSLSPDYILVSQAIDPLDFEGPDAENVIRLKFKGDRIWKETDIKEVLSFKILPDGSDMNALNYTIGTAEYLALPPKEGVSNYHKTPDGVANIAKVLLAPFIDNSTFTTELRNNRINVLLDTPFGALSPVLSDTTDFFAKSNVSTTFFAIVFNTQRLNREQRQELRKAIDARRIIERFYKVGSEQQRNIVDYKGNRNNYFDYINRSVFPSSSYYVEEKVVEPAMDDSMPNVAVLPDTIRIKACVNFGFREEYTELIDILNTPGISRARLKVVAVQNEELRNGDYDGLLVAFPGYRSNFLFDLYNIFLREPDLQTYKIHLITQTDAAGNTTVSPRSFTADKNFFRLDPDLNPAEREDILQFLNYLYGFMATRQIGDKQEYARRVDMLENRMALAKWLFSIPSLAYFSTQFDPASIDLYGVASQLSTIEKWRESAK
jgi:hypothetical protein